MNYYLLMLIVLSLFKPNHITNNINNNNINTNTKRLGFHNFYNNLTVKEKKNLSVLGNAYPDEFFILNIIMDQI